MKEYILKNTIFKDRLGILNKKKDTYKTITDRVTYQIEQFNKVWKKAQLHPFYKLWKEQYSLPTEITSLEELNSFPILTKSIIQKNKNLIFSNLTKYKTISTGGSTGEPTKFPCYQSELEIQYANAYVGRSWWKINPFDKIVLLWGHSHLFGSGLKGKINVLKRNVGDDLINTYRLSAYDLSEQSLLSYIEKIKMINPRVILGYTSAILELSKLILNNNITLTIDNLSCVIVTSETVFSKDKELIERAFNVPVAIEYGMAECGVIAYSHPKDQSLHVLWESFIVQQSDEQLLVSCLYDRAFPLIRYATGDNANIDLIQNSSVFFIKSIYGRTNDLLELRLLKNNMQVHSEIFTHIIKSLERVESFKIIQYKKSLSIVIKYIGEMDIEAFKTNFFNQIIKEFPDIDKTQFCFEKVEHIPKTIAGKTKWVEIVDE